jgi:hypothetical protein
MRPILLIALALGGCASTNAVLNQTPVETIRSERSAEAVAFCIQNKTDSAAADLDGAKVILHKGVTGGVIASYTVRPEGSGSVVEIRKGTAVSYPKWKDCY